MKRAVVLVLSMLVIVATLAPAASAARNQPTRGETADGRNPAGFGGGPHCHVLLVNSGAGPYDFIAVYPSHTGHASSSNAGVLAADFDCDGLPGTTTSEE